MKQLNRTDFPGRQYPNRIIQFGEGNFLRAFIGWQIDLLNEHTDFDAGVTIVRPINTDFPPSLNTQDGLYTTIIRGLNEQGECVVEKRLIRSVNQEINIYHDFDKYLALATDENIKIVFSNTTEAGICYVAEDKLTDAPPQSFPAKLTRLLFERYQHFNGAVDKGLVIIPCELIDYNGQALQEVVLRYAEQWQLPAAFTQWLNQHNLFCSTLVDRIVTGYPAQEAEALQQELNYQDTFLDTAEYFYLFVIQGPQSLKQLLCLDKLDLNVLIVDDIKPYKERKVAILNGAHTAMVPVAYLAGIDFVGDALADEQINQFIRQAIFDEIVPVLSQSEQELKDFAESVIKRFRNPYIQHRLLSIALNSMTKYRTRILPQLLAYQEKYHHLPVHLTFSLAALIAFYRGKRGKEKIPLQDDELWLKNYADWWRKYDDNQLTIKQLVENVLHCEEHWGTNLTQIKGLSDQVTSQLQAILEQGMRLALSHLGACK